MLDITKLYRIEYEHFYSDFVCVLSSSSASSLSSSSSSFSSCLFFPPISLPHGMLLITISRKKPPTPTVASVNTMSSGWDGPAFSLALVTEIHSLNLGSRKEFWLQSSSLQ